MQKYFFLRKSIKSNGVYLQICETVYNKETISIFFDCTNYYFEIDLPKEDKQNAWLQVLVH